MLLFNYPPITLPLLSMLSHSSHCSLTTFPSCPGGNVITRLGPLADLLHPQHTTQTAPPCSEQAPAGAPSPTAPATTGHTTLHALVAGNATPANATTTTNTDGWCFGLLQRYPGGPYNGEHKVKSYLLAVFRLGAQADPQTPPPPDLMPGEVTGPWTARLAAPHKLKRTKGGRATTPDPMLPVAAVSGGKLTVWTAYGVVAYRVYEKDAAKKKPATGGAGSKRKRCVGLGGGREMGWGGGSSLAGTSSCDQHAQQLLMLSLLPCPWGLHLCPPPSALLASTLPSHMPSTPGPPSPCAPVPSSPPHFFSSSPL